MALPASYAFTTTEDPLSATYWTTTTGMQALKATGGQCAKSGTSADSSMYWSADSFGNDQYAQAKYAVRSSDGGIWVRHAGSAISGYLFRVTNGSNASFYKVVTGTYTALGSIIGGTYADGDTFKLSVTGTTLEAFQNGTSLGTRTDSTHASGKTGLWCWDTAVRFDDFYADTIGGGGGIAMPILMHNMTGGFESIKKNGGFING